MALAQPAGAADLPADVLDVIMTFVLRAPAPDNHRAAQVSRAWHTAFHRQVTAASPPGWQCGAAGSSSPPLELLARRRMRLRLMGVPDAQTRLPELRLAGLDLSPPTTTKLVAAIAPRHVHLRRCCGIGGPALDGVKPEHLQPPTLHLDMCSISCNQPDQMRILMPRLAPVVTKLTANAPGETDGWSRVAPGYMGDLAGYLSDLKGLTSLTQLTLLRCNATTDFSFLPALTNLTGLHLAAEPKKPPVRLPLSAVPPLESLRLHRVTLDAPAIAGALAGRLSRLELLGPACWAGSLPAGAPLPLALTHAVLGDDPRPDAQRAAAAADTQALISPVAHAASLRFLRVAGTCRHAHGAADIPPPDWPHLQRLDLACFCALPALLPLPSLRAIRASLCEACRAGANAHRDAQLSAAWGAMACLPLLETLEVRGVLDPAELGDGELASKPLSPALEPLERLRAVLVVDYATEGTFGLRAAALRTLAVENRDPKGGPRPLDATLLKCTKLRRLDAWWPGARLPRGGGDGSVSRDMLELLGPSLEWGAFRPVNYVEPPDHFMPA